MATIKDIAKVAGVAQGTVSNVLNNRGNVSSDKIRRVLSACDQLGYVPNDQAKRLRQSHSRLIGVILPNLRDKRTIDFYISFKTCVENHGYSVRQYLSSSWTASNPKRRFSRRCSGTASARWPCLPAVSP